MTAYVERHVYAKEALAPTATDPRRKAGKEILALPIAKTIITITACNRVSVNCKAFVMNELLLITCIL